MRLIIPDRPLTIPVIAVGRKWCQVEVVIAVEFAIRNRSRRGFQTSSMASVLPLVRNRVHSCTIVVMIVHDKSSKFVPQAFLRPVACFRTTCVGV